MSPDRHDPPSPEARTSGGEPPTVPDRPIGPYKLLEELGRGGMGVVYLAARADEQYQKRVAIKVIKAGMDGAEVVRQFRRERQILAGLDHPNIARLLDGGATQDGLPYLVMEYIQGEPLHAYCDSRRLPIVERLRIFQQVCAAVACAHRNLIVHRDLKPSNILITGEGVPRLLDFGIAKLLNPELSGGAPTATGLAMTPEYASPEQARVEVVTTSSDVYSLGVLLYELLTGRRPYRLKTRQLLEVLRAVCEEEPEKPSAAVGRTEEVTDGSPTRAITAEEASVARESTPEKLRRRLSGDLDSIVLMALRKEPQRRYASVEALSEDIRRHLEGSPVTARKGTAAYRMGKYVRRHPVGVAAAAAFVALLMGFAVTMAVQSARLARQRDTAASERDRAEKVSGFLVDLFKVSDPSEAKGNRVTAREILDKGASKIGAEVNEQPDVKAALMDTMSRVYDALGLYDRARPLAEGAVDLRKQALGTESLEVARSLRSLATVLLHEGNYVGSETLDREALQMQRKLLGNQDPEVATSLHGLGTVLYRRGDYAGAEARYREAVAIQRKLFGNGNPDLAKSLGNLASVLDDEGDLAGAESLYREAVAMQRKLLGNQHPDLARSLNNLANILDERADYAGAEALVRETLAMRRKLFGDEHPDIATSLDNLGNVLWQEGAYAEAEVVHRQGVAMSRKLLGNEHPELATNLNNLALVLEDKGNDAEAEAVDREALEIRRKVLGNEHPEVAESLSTLGRALYHQHRLREAENACRESLEIRCKVLPPDHPDIATSLIGLGEVLAAEGWAPQAETMLREGLEIRRKKLVRGHPQIAEAESTLGACLTRLRRFDEAEPLLLGSYQLLNARQSANASTRAAWRHLIDLYDAWEKPDKAALYRAKAGRSG
jgi:tetratricopeptide (TPR) repeat protein/predicted Ser/Thr protein kinase